MWKYFLIDEDHVRFGWIVKVLLFLPIIHISFISYCTMSARSARHVIITVQWIAKRKKNIIIFFWGDCWLIAIFHKKKSYAQVLIDKWHLNIFFQANKSMAFFNRLVFTGGCWGNCFFLRLWHLCQSIKLVHTPFSIIIDELMNQNLFSGDLMRLSVHET